MDITELGRTFREAYPEDNPPDGSDYEVGAWALENYPYLWEHIDSQVVSRVSTYVEKETFKISGMPHMWGRWKAEKAEKYFDQLSKAVGAYVRFTDVTLIAQDADRRAKRAPKDLANADRIQDAINASDRISMENKAIEAQLHQRLLPKQHEVSHKQIDLQSARLDHEMAVLKAAAQAGLPVEAYVQLTTSQKTIAIEEERKRRLDAAELDHKIRLQAADREHLVQAEAIEDQHNERNRQRSRTNDSRGQKT